MKQELEGMDNLGERIRNDLQAAAHRREHAQRLEQQAQELRREADEIERLVENARRAQR